MHIAHVLSQNELTGAEVYAVSLVQEQIFAGHKVYQISNNFFKATEATKFKIDVEVKSKIQFIKNIFVVRKFLKLNSIHVVHSHSRAASKLIFYATLGLKIGTLSTIHGRQHVSFSKKLFNQYGQFIIPVCENITKQLKNEFEYNPRYIQTIPNGLDPQIFNFKEKKAFKQNTVLKIALIGRQSGPKKIRNELFIKHFSELLTQKNILFKILLIASANEKIIINSELLHQYDLICGSGRVCIEALISGVPCIAFGESAYLGLTTKDNFDSHCVSNFGDIGQNFDWPQFNFKQAEIDIKNIFSNDFFDLKSLSQLALSKFQLKSVSQQIMRVYESAYFIANYNHWIPILMYHKITNTSLNTAHKIYVTKKNFEKHLRFFYTRNLTPVTFNELVLYRKAQKDWSDFPKNPFILTFDDGYEDNLLNADDLLKKYSYKAHIYLLAEDSIDHNTWDSEVVSTDKHPIVSKQNRQKWNQSQFVIGSHGIKHDRMPLMTESEKLDELVKSKVLLENEFNVKVNSFAYTFGDTNLDCSKACQKAGYDYGLNTDSGGLTLEENPYSIFRVNIFPDETIFSLWKKTSKWYRRYYQWKRNK